jgi:hypothetical protein
MTKLAYIRLVTAGWFLVNNLVAGLGGEQRRSAHRRRCLCSRDVLRDPSLQRLAMSNVLRTKDGDAHYGCELVRAVSDATRYSDIDGDGLERCLRSTVGLWGRRSFTGDACHSANKDDRIFAAPVLNCGAARRGMRSPSRSTSCGSGRT